MHSRHRSLALSASVLALAACADPVAPAAPARPADLHVPRLALVPTSTYGATFVEAFDIYNPEHVSAADSTFFPDSAFWLRPPAPWRPTDIGAGLPNPVPSDTGFRAYSPYFPDIKSALATWTVAKHDKDDWYAMRPTMAWHRASDCAAPPEKHLVASYDESTFLCRNHMMTAVNARTYGVTYLTPNRMVDFSSGSATIRFDVATLRDTKNDWIDLWVTPYDYNLVTPLDEELEAVDLQGPPRYAFHVRMTATSRTVSAFRAAFIIDHHTYWLPVATADGYETKFAQSATVRRRFELQLTPTRIRFGMPNENLWWIDAALPPGTDLPFDHAVVQVGHHSMNPAGDGGGPTTWHWDNIGIAPSVPLTIVNADRRYADATAPAVTLRGAAPAGARLRFAANGRKVEVSFDDGSTWVDARKQQEGLDVQNRFHSYWMPIPAGTTRARFRASAASGMAGWFVRDVSVWAPGA
jgi:hypothetical protein